MIGRLPSDTATSRGSNEYVLRTRKCKKYDWRRHRLLRSSPQSAAQGVGAKNALGHHGSPGLASSTMRLFAPLASSSTVAGGKECHCGTGGLSGCNTHQQTLSCSLCQAGSGGKGERAQELERIVGRGASKRRG